MADIINDYCHECGKPYATSRQVAGAMGVSPSTLSRWLAGKNEPSAHLLDAADAYIQTVKEHAVEQKAIRDGLR